MKTNILFWVLLVITGVPSLIILMYAFAFICFYLFNIPFWGPVCSYKGYCNCSIISFYKVFVCIQTLLLLLAGYYTLLSNSFQVRKMSQKLFHIVNAVSIFNLICVTAIVCFHPLLVNNRYNNDGRSEVSYSNPLIYHAIFFSAFILIKTYRFYSIRKGYSAIYLRAVSGLIIILMIIAFWALNNSITYERCAG